MIFDEIHKYTHWKTFLKGLYDSNPNKLQIIVTGSARTEVFNKGGESLMGRYFPYRLHPLTVAEIVRPKMHDTEVSLKPCELDNASFEKLLKFGGFPDPYIKAENRFVYKWRCTAPNLVNTNLRLNFFLKILSPVRIVSASYGRLARDVFTPLILSHATPCNLL